MEEKVNLLKKTWKKDKYNLTIDTEFKELGVKNLAEYLDSSVDVDTFFKYYNELFFDIPPTGDTNSHEYLAKTSGEYINYESQSEEIEALREEITQLKKDLLTAQMENLKLQSPNGELQSEIEKVANTINDLEL